VGKITSVGRWVMARIDTDQPRQHGPRAEATRSGFAGQHFQIQFQYQFMPFSAQYSNKKWL
jgi:hypothetical protein